MVILIAQSDAIATHTPRIPRLNTFAKIYAAPTLKRSIDNLSVKIVEYQQDLAELNNKLIAVKKNQLTKDTVLKVLSHFSLFFDRMTPADQQVLLRSLVEEIQIFPDVTEDGRIIKSIKLSVPVVYENEKTPKISWDKLTPVESIVCLTHDGFVDCR